MADDVSFGNDAAGYVRILRDGDATSVAQGPTATTTLPRVPWQSGMAWLFFSVVVFITIMVREREQGTSAIIGAAVREAG